MSKRIAIVRIRKEQEANRKVRDTLKRLRLFKKNTCSIVTNDPKYVGMIKVIKDYVTWGELDEETFKLLLKKRGRLPGNKLVTEDYIKEKTKIDLDKFAKEFMETKRDLKEIDGLKQFFRLTPPVKGFERKGIKIPFSQGGALGYRKEKINELIKRMI